MPAFGKGSHRGPRKSTARAFNFESPPFRRPPEFVSPTNSFVAMTPPSCARGRGQRGLRQHRRHPAAGPPPRLQHSKGRRAALHAEAQGQGRSPSAGLQLLRPHRAHAPAAGGPGRHVGLQHRTLPLHGGNRRLQQVVQTLGIPCYVYSDDGSEFKAEFKQRLDYYDVDKVVSRKHAYFVERLIRTLKRGSGAQALRRPRGSELLAPAAARRPGTVQRANSWRHRSNAEQGLQRSDPSKAEHACDAGAGQAQGSASAHALSGG